MFELDQFLLKMGGVLKRRVVSWLGFSNMSFLLQLIFVVDEGI